MKIAKNYTAIVIAPVFLLFWASLITLLIIEPFTGDLTRVGGFSERQFGWNQPMPVLIRKNVDAEIANPDILVIGDSYSISDGMWQSELYKKTGLTIYTKSIYGMNKESLLEEVAKKRPKLVLIETVERIMPSWFSRNSAYGYKSDCTTSTVPSKNTLRLSSSNKAWSDVTELMVSRRRYPSKIEEVGQAVHFLKLNLFGQRQVARLQLSRNDLFTNNSSGEILVHADELIKPFREFEKRDIECSLRVLQNEIRAHGVNSFYLVIPDKTAAYRSYILDSRMSDYVPLTQQLNMAGIDHLDVSGFVRDRVNSPNVKDVYKPNDSHWSGETFISFGDFLSEQLSRPQF